jgi:RimJ/RimL family protein N-acetyltransferase
MDLTNWKGVARPAMNILDGRYVRLEPLSTASHSDSLYDSAIAPGAVDRFRYLFEAPPASRADFDGWIAKAAAGSDPFFYAVVNKATGRAEGRQALMRIDTTHGVIEIGSILWGPAMARSRLATEALYLFAKYAFDCGYRRFEWKCHSMNEPSKRAALRFGFVFEGIFRQHMVAKGKNRDTAWYSIIDTEWPQVKQNFDAWLSPQNFDGDGMQLSKLQARAGL